MITRICKRLILPVTCFLVLCLSVLPVSAASPAFEPDKEPEVFTLAIGEFNAMVTDELYAHEPTSVPELKIDFWPLYKYTSECLQDESETEAEQCQPPEPSSAKCLDLDLLHRIVWAEARGEDDIGQILVVNVIMNRLNSGNFPDSISCVIYQRNRNSSGTWVYQFSPVQNGSFHRATPCDRIIANVERALAGEDHSQGSLFFRMIDGAAGGWHERNLSRVLDHGTHRFYV